MIHRQFRGHNRLPTAREQSTLRAIASISAKFGNRDDDGRANHKLRAVEVYLIRASLGWSFSRIQRRLGIDLFHAITIYPKGRALVHQAVAEEKITPGMVARLLPDKVFF